MMREGEPKLHAAAGKGKTLCHVYFSFQNELQPTDVLIQNSTSHGDRRERCSGCLCGRRSELLPAHFCLLHWSLCHLRAADAAWLSPFCVSLVHSVAQNFVFVCHFFFLLLFVLSDSPQPPKLLLPLNSNPPLVQGRLGWSTTGLFVVFGSDAYRPECTCLGFCLFGCFVLFFCFVW